MTENKDKRTSIIIATLALAGVLGTAIIGNIEKFSSCATSPNGNTNATPSRNFDVLGTWVGNDNRHSEPVTLFIGQQNGNSFSGILNLKSARVAFTGSIDNNTKQITIKDTHVISQNVQKDGAWSLTETKGVISSDGKQIITVGEDTYGVISGKFVKQD